jgi:hypothetical protein
MTAHSQSLAQLISTNQYLSTLPPSQFQLQAMQQTQAAILANIQMHSASSSVSPVPFAVPAVAVAAAPVPEVVVPAVAVAAAPVPEVVECSICKSDITMLQTTTRSPCNHLFHHACLSPWMNRSVDPRCPLCRARLVPVEEEQDDEFGADF